MSKRQIRIEEFAKLVRDKKIFIPKTKLNITYHVDLGRGSGKTCMVEYIKQRDKLIINNIQNIDYEIQRQIITRWT